MSETSKQRMDKAVKEAIDSGNSNLANEITANVMVGTTMLIVFTVMILCLILNEIGVFAVSKPLMRWGVFAAAIVEVPITILNTIYVGTKKWLKIPLMVDLILVCGILSATLGYNVTLAMVFPLVVSTRYFDEKYTLWVALCSAIVFLLCNLVNAGIGELDLNYIHLAEGTTITWTGSFDDFLEAIKNSNGFDLGNYKTQRFVYDFIPRCLIFLALSVSCRFVASRGKKMIEVNAANAEKNARIETELSLATNIQANMLPSIFPAFPERDEIDLYATMTPAKEVGGDFYDFFAVDDHHIAVVMADVSGKGVPAALFMVIAKTLIKDHTNPDKDPGEIFTEVNKLLCEADSENLFVTAFEGVLDLRNGEFKFVNAGHEIPYICKKDKKYAPQKVHPSFVLSGLEHMKYKTGIMQLDPGDKFFQYTDGVTEATNANNELYGMDRLTKILEDNSDKKPHELLPLIKEDIDKFVGEAPQFDDITMLAFEYKGNKK